MAGNFDSQIFKNRILAGDQTITGLWGCTITNVNPYKMEVDVRVDRLAKNIEGVKLLSSLQGKNHTSIAIPEVGTDAVLASMEGHAEPFLIGFKARQTYEKDGFFPDELFQGEAIDKSKRQAFIKKDVAGNLFLASGHGNFITFLDNSIYESSRDKKLSLENLSVETSLRKRVSDRENEDELSATEVLEISQGLVSMLIEDNGESIFALIKSINESKKDMGLLEKIETKISDFLNEEKGASLDIDGKSVYLNEKDLNFYFHEFLASKTIQENFEEGTAPDTLSGLCVTEVYDDGTILETKRYSGGAGLIKETIKFPSGKIYQRTTELNKEVDGIIYSTYSETRELLEYQFYHNFEEEE